MSYKVDVEITRVKTPEDIIVRVSMLRGIPEQEVAKMMSYNVLTVEQVAELTGLQAREVIEYTTPKWEKGKLVSRLTKCYPFPSRRAYPYVVRDGLFDELVFNSIK
jgi:hypothetical protein